MIIVAATSLLAVERTPTTGMPHARAKSPRNKSEKQTVMSGDIGSLCKSTIMRLILLPLRTLVDCLFLKHVT